MKIDGMLKQVEKDIYVASIVIAGGVGSFEPRKFPLKDCEKFEETLYFIQ